MELARGQGLAADRLPNHLAETMASSPWAAAISSLACRLQGSLLARLDLGMAGGCSGGGLQSLLGSIPFGKDSFPSSAILIHL